MLSDHCLPKVMKTDVDPKSAPRPPSSDLVVGLFDDFLTSNSSHSLT